MRGFDERDLLGLVTHLECEGCGFVQPISLNGWYEFIDDVRLETALLTCECSNPAGAPVIIADKPLIGVPDLDEENRQSTGRWKYYVDEGLLQLLRARGMCA